MATAGRVLLMSKGAWVSGTSYSPMDYVYYGGNSYVCKSATSGTTTPDNDTTHWQLMASGFDMDMITQTITNEQNKIASDAAVYAETVKLEAQDAALAADIATVETTSTASKAYSVGEYLVYNNQLYKVISAIASGGTLTVGTNISATSAGGELTSIKESLSNLLYVNEQTVNVAFSNESYKVVSVTPTAISGYTPIGVIGFRIGAINYHMVQIAIRSVSDLTVYIQQVDRTAVTATVAVYVHVLYKKSS